MNSRPVTSNLHLIVTCTRSKTVAAGSTVFPEERDAVRAYESWLQMLGQTLGEQPLLAVGELYSGQHWQRAVAAAESTGAELWVLSAGLGLLHISDRVVPYEATFSSMQASPRNIWSLLTSSPPTGRRCASLQALMQKRPHDRFIVAASPVYLQAVEEDLCAGRDELASPEQMTIVTSKGYRGCLGNNVTLSSAAMMKELNTNMTGLNISHAVKILKMQDERVTINAA
jgi:hypothetical protein